MKTRPLGKRIVDPNTYRDEFPGDYEARKAYMDSVVRVNNFNTDTCGYHRGGIMCRATPTTLVRISRPYYGSYYARCDEHKHAGYGLPVARIVKGRVSA